MTVPCQSVDVYSGSNITATEITATPATTPCIQPCSVNVSVTWENQGDVVGTFTPSLTVDDIPVTVTPPLSPVTLNPTESTTQAFTITGLTKAGSPHSICPVPN